ncbi:hypothetical protein [Granulicella pectinivorans]|uniref:hypothetical protein n=1 Tax=Granulicella pectinivorans TaxID=474950 RepID=UPI0011408766|nr:hypothetical protein [Granulicella pectinivorans]
MAVAVALLAVAVALLVVAVALLVVIPEGDLLLLLRLPLLASRHHPKADPVAPIQDVRQAGISGLTAVDE